MDHIALLRGVNVGGGRKIVMDDLRQFASDLGLERPRTYIASGNLVLSGWDKGEDALEALLEQEAEVHLGLQTSFFVRSAQSWSELMAANPFPEEAALRPEKLVAMLLKQSVPAAQLATLRRAIVGHERVEAGPRALFVDFPDGQGRSTLDRDWARTRQAPLATARNWNTVRRLADMAGA
jgi:uncharacterized protein (DUF1697 family)